MKLTRAKKREIERTCNLLPFVRWDRFVEYAEGVTVCGWIDRADAYKDFVSVSFYADGTVDYLTSSAKYSLEIYKLLNQGNGLGHRKCKRIEDHFTVDNAIALKKL